MIKKITGTVTKGKGQGHLYAMPTANILTTDELPPEGVYAGYALLDNQKHLALINVGKRPSADDNPQSTTEAYILDFSQNIYNKQLTLIFMHYLRGIQKFPDGLAGVRRQVAKDEAKARELLKEDL